jgi:hypothetical protein
MTAPAFFMVCRSPRHAGAKTEPRVRYGTEGEARAVAQRLANETDAPHVVLAATVTLWPQGRTRSLF